VNKEPVDIDRFLPHGEMLRGFIEQPFISKADLTEALRKRGVFLKSTEKRDVIPWLVGMMLAPDEFDRLREAQRTKEDNPKVNTQSLPWSSSATLLDGIPDEFDIASVLELEFSNYAVVGTPNFVPINGNPEHLILDFEIERSDLSKNWATTQSRFRGSLELEKTQDGKEVKLVVTHTASETKQVATKALQGLLRHFKSGGYVDHSAEIAKILFSTFDNSSRVLYFLSLTRDVASPILAFEDIVDLEFSPDSTSKLPDGMAWMEKKIEDLKVNGSGLHETFFITNEEYHPYVYLYQIDARYSFYYKGIEGKCVISAGFPEYRGSREVACEFEVNVKNVSFKTQPRDITRNEVVKALLREFDRLKLDRFTRLIKDTKGSPRALDLAT